MRKLLCIQIPGQSVQEALEEFNKRAGEFGMSSEADIVSVGVMPLSTGIKLHTLLSSIHHKVEVVIVFWGQDQPAAGVGPADEGLVA